MRRKRRWRKVLIFLTGFFVAYLIGCYVLAARYVRPQIANHGGPPNGFIEMSEPNMWVTPGIKGDGVLPASNSKSWNELVRKNTVFVLVHGYGGSQSRWKEVAEELVRRGHQVIIPALPGHDNLTDQTCGFGQKESDILVNDIRWVRQNWELPAQFVLVGISMGGASCWLATEKDPDIDAIATEGCFTRLDTATTRWFNTKAPGASFYLYPVIWFAKRISGVDPSTINPIEAAKKWKGRPALVIQADSDQLFPEEEAHALADASGAEFWSVPGATHSQCSDIDLDGYVSRLEKLANALPPAFTHEPDQSK